MTDRADVWTADAARITDPETLGRLQRILEDESPVVVEHRFYRGARAPHRFVADDYDELEAYLRARTSPGDNFMIWHFDQCCRNDNVLVSGKCPDGDGKVPLGGAY